MTPDDLRDIRARLGWTQTNLADALVVSRATIANWEAGKHRVPYAAKKLLESLEEQIGRHDREVQRQP